LSVNKAELAAHRAEDLIEVDVDGTTGWFPPEDIDALADPPEPPRVRLLPPGDPYLQTRDRKLIVPDAKAQKVLWRILGNPGAVLVDGEIVAAWRAKAVGRRRLEFQLEPFDELPPDVGSELDAEAQLIATARGISEATVG
ncbi:MAG TPA: crosslink repair DNA glycosylase YcaQ family protein, partial [Pseudonocardiaceae bacterium]|nr:crosslink repair DNA glycosylase YcaQ family protein [Pseudonocardiaceae bacterium]